MTRSQIQFIEDTIVALQSAMPILADENKAPMYRIGHAEAIMQAVASRLQKMIEIDAKRPDPLGDALNSSDGTYRP